MPTLAEAASYGVPTNLNQTTSVNGVGLVWDLKGNLDQYGTTDYQWTFGNRLWRVVKPASTTEYAYDSMDRRTMVIADGVMTRTLWSGADEVGEYDAAGTLQRRFIPDGSGAMDARLAMVSSTGDVSWFHTNHQGSVIAMSNASGAATGFANYSEYGKFGTDAAGSPLNSPPGGSPFGYTGRQWDAKAGLYNYRARYYDPVLGVFLSMDPIGTKDDPNLYMYVGLDPVNKTDPTGLEVKTQGDCSQECRVYDEQRVQTTGSRIWSVQRTHIGYYRPVEGGAEMDPPKEGYADVSNYHRGQWHYQYGGGTPGQENINSIQGVHNGIARSLGQSAIDSSKTMNQLDQQGGGSRNIRMSFATPDITAGSITLVGQMHVAIRGNGWPVASGHLTGVSEPFDYNNNPQRGAVGNAAVVAAGVFGETVTLGGARTFTNDYYGTIYYIFDRTH